MIYDTNVFGSIDAAIEKKLSEFEYCNYMFNTFSGFYFIYDAICNEKCNNRNIYNVIRQRNSKIDNFNKKSMRYLTYDANIKEKFGDGEYSLLSDIKWNKYKRALNYYEKGMKSDDTYIEDMLKINSQSKVISLSMFIGFDVALKVRKYHKKYPEIKIHNYVNQIIFSWIYLCDAKMRILDTLISKYNSDDDSDKTESSDFSDLIRQSKQSILIQYPYTFTKLVFKFKKYIDVDFNTINEYISSLYENIKPETIDVLYCRAKGKTLEEIGDIKGVTRERIRQIEAKGNIEIFKLLFSRDILRILKKIYLYILYESDDYFVLNENADFYKPLLLLNNTGLVKYNKIGDIEFVSLNVYDSVQLKLEKYDFVISYDLFSVLDSETKTFIEHNYRKDDEFKAYIKEGFNKTDVKFAGVNAICSNGYYLDNEEQFKNICDYLYKKYGVDISSTTIRSLDAIVQRRWESPDKGAYIPELPKLLSDEQLHQIMRIVVDEKMPILYRSLHYICGEKFDYYNLKNHRQLKTLLDEMIDKEYDFLIHKRDYIKRKDYKGTFNSSLWPRFEQYKGDFITFDLFCSEINGVDEPYFANKISENKRLINCYEKTYYYLPDDFEEKTYNNLKTALDDYSKFANGIIDIYNFIDFYTYDDYIGTILSNDQLTDDMKKTFIKKITSFLFKNYEYLYDINILVSSKYVIEKYRNQNDSKKAILYILTKNKNEIECGTIYREWCGYAMLDSIFEVSYTKLIELLCEDFIVFDDSKLLAWTWDKFEKECLNIGHIKSVITNSLKGISDTFKINKDFYYDAFPSIERMNDENIEINKIALYCLVNKYLNSSYKAYFENDNYEQPLIIERLHK